MFVKALGVTVGRLGQHPPHPLDGCLLMLLRLAGSIA